MFKKCNVYCYSGLYLDEVMLQELEIKKASGLDITCMLSNYNSVYNFNDNQFQKINGNSLMTILLNDKNKTKEFFYRVKNGSFILVPIQQCYGISGLNNNLIVYYDDKTIRDAKIAHANREGIQVLTEDIDRGRNQISEFNNQYQLRKIYSALTMEDK